MTEQIIKKPNFFIIGAPKCGTTSMSEYLRTHPDVFFSHPKDPHYFDVETRPVDRHFRTENDYLRLFQGSSNFKAVGEGTALYLYAKSAVPAILRLNPDAKFIVMFRNPVDMVQSWHSQQIKMLRESVTSLEEAWKLQTVRALGKKIPSGCKRPALLQYSDMCSLGSQLERLYDSVSRDHVHIIFFDDLVSDPLSTYKGVLGFLNLPYDGRTDFHVANANKIARGFVLRRVLHSLFLIRTRLAMWLTGSPVPTSFSLGLGRLVSPFLYRTGKRQPLDPEFRNELVTYFEPEVRKIEALTGRDLTSWRT